MIYNPLHCRGFFIFVHLLPMQTNHIYHYITGVAFLLAALALLIFPSLAGGIAPKYKYLLAGVMALWGSFRMYNGFQISKRQNRDDK